jgi:hypothetical protein
VASNPDEHGQLGDVYDAFLSYGRLQDITLARRLQRRVERFATPWYRGRSLRIFRDETNLSVDPSLRAAILRRLWKARWLLLLASPAAAQSTWVDVEVTEWLRAHQGSTDRLLIALTDGNLMWDRQFGGFRRDDGPDVLPPSLYRAIADEPLWVDLRESRLPDGSHAHTAEFDDAVANIAATLHGVEKDTLVGEHVRTRRQSLSRWRTWPVPAPGWWVSSPTCRLWPSVCRSDFRSAGTRPARTSSERACDDSATRALETASDQVRRRRLGYRLRHRTRRRRLVHVERADHCGHRDPAR